MLYNTLWRPQLGLARWLGLAAKQPASSWLSKQDVLNLCELADWDVFEGIHSHSQLIQVQFRASGEVPD